MYSTGFNLFVDTSNSDSWLLMITLFHEHYFQVMLCRS
jgi:hypothetical protein